MQNYTLPKLVNSVLISHEYFEIKAESSVYPEMKLDVESSSPAVQELLKDTTPEILKEVKSYVVGNSAFNPQVVNEGTVFAYLAAAKIIDLTIPVDQQNNSTIVIRDACLAEPNSLKNNQQISLLNGYIIPDLAESRIQFLNRFDEVSNREIRVPQEDFAKTTAFFHSGSYPRIENVFKNSLNAIVESTKWLQLNLFFAGPMGVGKSRHITHFVSQLSGSSMDLKNIVYGTDHVKTFLREEYPTCQSGPSFVLGMVLRHVLETAVKTRSTKDLFFLQEGVLSNDPVALGLLKNTRVLEIRDHDAPFKMIALRALNREHLRMERPLDFKGFAGSAANCRKVRLTLLDNLTEDHQYTLNYNGKILTADEARKFEYNEPDLEAIGNEIITLEDISELDPGLKVYVNKTVFDAFNTIDKLFKRES
jgi:hypothetical protein